MPWGGSTPARPCREQGARHGLLWCSEHAAAQPGPERQRHRLCRRLLSAAQTARCGPSPCVRPQRQEHATTQQSTGALWRGVDPPGRGAAKPPAVVAWSSRCRSLSRPPGGPGSEQRSASPAEGRWAAAERFRLCRHPPPPRWCSGPQGAAQAAGSPRTSPRAIAGSSCAPRGLPRLRHRLRGSHTGGGLPLSEAFESLMLNVVSKN